MPLSKKEKQIHNREFKDKVKDFLEIGITEDTLLAFFKQSIIFGDMYKDMSNTKLKKLFKEVFDEVDPP
jgi:hypothetical protein